MKVIFSPDIFLEQRVGGISRVFIHLISEVSQITGTNNLSRNLPPIFIHQNLYLSTILPFGYIRKIPSIALPIVKFINTTSLLCFVWASFIKTHGSIPIVIHYTYYDFIPRSLLPRNVRTIATFHDMIPELLQINKKVTRKKKKLYLNIDMLVAISRKTFDDIRKIYCNSAPRCNLSLIPNGIHSYSQYPPSKHIFLKPYILYVGNTDGYKNFKTLLTAFELIHSDFRDLRLVLFGSRLPKIPDNLIDKVTCINGSDALLEQAYREAEILVYPSTHEGFGIPPFEALLTI